MAGIGTRCVPASKSRETCRMKSTHAPSACMFRYRGDNTAALESVGDVQELLIQYFLALCLWLQPAAGVCRRILRGGGCQAKKAICKGVLSMEVAADHHTIRHLLEGTSTAALRVYNSLVNANMMENEDGLLIALIIFIQMRFGRNDHVTFC